MKDIILHATSLDELRVLIREEIKNGLAEYFANKTGSAEKSSIYWTRKEAAQQLKITLPTLNEWTKSGRVKSYNISGRRIYYKPEDLEKAMKERIARIRR